MLARAPTTRRAALFLSARVHPRPLSRQTAYHSYSHANPSPYSSSVAESVLATSLKLVPQHGFTQDTLRLGLRDAGYLSISTNLFPQGAFDLVMYYLISRRLALHDFASTSDASADPAERVRTLILRRLRMNHEAGVIQAWPQALAVMAQPTYTPQAVAELGRLADDIYFLAGDKSVDTSWYTKRASLCALYAAAEMHQTHDTSIDLQDTEQFVDSRLSELQSARTGLTSVAEWVNFTGHSFFNVIRSKGMRL